MNVLITGGSGLVGSYLTKLLTEKGHQVSWLSRTPGEKDGIKRYAWNVKAGTIDQEAIRNAEAIIHLAGAGVADKRWTASRKAEILESRTQSTKLLYRELELLRKAPIPFVSASAIGYYGFSTSDAILDENSAPGTDFLAKVTKAWEDEVSKIETLGHTVSKIRIGIVLSTDGGALKEMTAPPVVAPLGSGKQWMPWIHMHDLCLLFMHALENNLSGPFNAVSPQPERHVDFMKSIAKAARKPYLGIPAPTFVLKIALGEMADMLVNGTRISAQRIQSTGFEFRFPDLDDALTELYQ
jgi:uncharacterized protein (TIGR01777 family)